MSRKSLKSKGYNNQYRSGLEATFAKILPRRKFSYEPFNVPYTMYRNYKPDFVHKATGIMIECKGFFRAGDTMKYKAIRDSIDKELIFLLSDPNKKIRKGAKMTMGQWCEKENFKFFTIGQTEELVKYVSA
jgi:hypothetical protein